METKNYIRDARIARGLSIAETATLIGVKYQTYYYWDTGVSSPKKEEIKKVCKVLGLTTDQVLGIS